MSKKRSKSTNGRGGARAGAGRKARGDEPLTGLFSLRVSEADLELLRRADTDRLRRALIREARRG